MSDEEGKVKVTDSLTELYGKLDGHLDEVLLKKFKATCTKGCAHCCYLLATITFAEGLLIAEKLLMGPDWKDWVPKLRDAAKKVDYIGITRVNYFSKGQPCVFLGKDNLCQIYEYRPACCRYHVVGSPAELCSYLAPPTARTMTLDLRGMEEKVWELSMAVVTQLGIQELMVGPLPLMVLACMYFVTQNPTEDQDIADHSIINEACKTLRSPFQWMKHCGITLVLEEGEKASQEKIPIEKLKEMLR